MSSATNGFLKFQTWVSFVKKLAEKQTNVDTTGMIQKPSQCP